MIGKVSYMLSRLRSANRPLITGVLSLFLVGCGLFKSESDTYFDTAALATGRILFASHESDNPGAALSLYTVNRSAGNTVQLYAFADFDFTSPTIVNDPEIFWLIGFGKSRLVLLDSYNTKDSQQIVGLGTEQRALAFDNYSPVRLAWMDGSSSGGFNIVVQSSLPSEPVAVTSDASDTVSYWTPAWSPDGEWILYARIAGTTGAEAQLWRVRPDGSDAEALPIVTTELPTYAVFSPDGTEVLVPGDFTSYYIDDGRVGKFDHIREMETFQQQLADLGYELVGSPITGVVHPGETVTGFRHTFPISAHWILGDWIHFDALVATNYGSSPHEVLGVAIFSWVRISQRLLQHTQPVPLSEARTEDHSISVLHPTRIP